MTSRVFIGIDGTGPSEDAEYNAAFDRSYVKLLSEWARFKHRHYSRGPSLLGLETGPLADWAVSTALTVLRIRRDARIHLCGYSRGGAAAIRAAALLGKRGVEVDSLILFDAVDRSNIGETDRIPANVQWCRHAMRSDAAGSRVFFGNCGLVAARSGVLERRRFLTTHGGMGGTPFGPGSISIGGHVHEMQPDNKVLRAALRASALVDPTTAVINGLVNLIGETNITPKQEASGSAAVWRWMSSELARRTEGP